jgi:beta-lactamase superfamily II metal-dependent hydrolase
MDKDPFTYVCQAESFFAAKDYIRGGRCVRFTGTYEEQIDLLESDAGISTFTIDVDYWEFAAMHAGYSFVDTFAAWHLSTLFDEKEEAIEAYSQWYELKFRQEPKGLSYLYPSFSSEQPIFLQLVSIRSLGNTLPQPRVLLNLGNAPLSSTPRRTQNAYHLDAFHVGQGMCSLVSNGTNGVLLDAGAGKPVTRKQYPDIRNDLITTVRQLSTLDLIISHPDADHWRLLDWDPTLVSKIRHIIVPSGTASLALKNRSVVKKVRSTDSFVAQLNPQESLSVFRSSPSKSDRNGECLIALFCKGNKMALIPGDYVYERFSSDGNSQIKALASGIFDGVIVPHHGDTASSKHVVQGSASSRAFFSAGTHQKYKHPRKTSIKAHRLAKFLVVVRNKLTYIRRRRIL